MKKTIKIPALLLVILMLILGTAAAVSASPDGGSTYDEPTPIPIDEPIDEPVDDPITDDEPIYTQPDYPDYPGDYDPSYDGSGDAGSVKDSNQLTDAKAPAEKDIAPVQWTNIKISEDNKADQKDTGISFQTIKESSDSDKSDDGSWLLWIGYGLIILAVLFIVYFIVATVNAKKQAARDERHNAGTHGPGGSGGSHADRSASRSSESRSSGHYADGYETTRRGSKADTGEVYVPRRAVK